MVKTKCPKCEYTWDYKGKLARRTCPNCGYNWIVRRGRPTKKKYVQRTNIPKEEPKVIKYRRPKGTKMENIEIKTGGTGGM